MTKGDGWMDGWMDIYLFGTRNTVHAGKELRSTAMPLVALACMLSLAGKGGFITAR
jgi:hypothetical protein